MNRKILSDKSPQGLLALLTNMMKAEDSGMEEESNSVNESEKEHQVEFFQFNWNTLNGIHSSFQGPLSLFSLDLSQSLTTKETATSELISSLHGNSKLWSNLGSDLQETIRTSLVDQIIQSPPGSKLYGSLLNLFKEIVICLKLEGDTETNWPELLRRLFELYNSKQHEVELKALKMIRLFLSKLAEGIEKADYAKLSKILDDGITSKEIQIQNESLQIFLYTISHLNGNTNTKVKKLKSTVIPMVFSVFRENSSDTEELLEAMKFAIEENEEFMNLIPFLTENIMKVLQSTSIDISRRHKIFSILELLLEHNSKIEFQEEEAIATLNCIITEMAIVCKPIHEGWYSPADEMTLEVANDLEGDLNKWLRSSDIIFERSKDRQLESIIDGLVALNDEKDNWKYLYASLRCIAVTACRHLFRSHSLYIDLVCESFKHENPRVRQGATQAVYCLTCRSGKIFYGWNFNRLVPILVDMLHDPVPAVSLYACESIVGFLNPFEGMVGVDFLPPCTILKIFDFLEKDHIIMVGISALKLISSFAGSKKYSEEIRNILTNFTKRRPTTKTAVLSWNIVHTYISVLKQTHCEPSDLILEEFFKFLKELQEVEIENNNINEAPSLIKVWIKITDLPYKSVEKLLYESLPNIFKIFDFLFDSPITLKQIELLDKGISTGLSLMVNIFDKVQMDLSAYLKEVLIVCMKFKGFDPSGDSGESELVILQIYRKLVINLKTYYTPQMHMFPLYLDAVFDVILNNEFESLKNLENLLAFVLWLLSYLNGDLLSKRTVKLIKKFLNFIVGQVSQLSEEQCIELFSGDEGEFELNLNEIENYYLLITKILTALTVHHTNEVASSIDKLLQCRIFLLIIHRENTMRLHDTGFKYIAEWLDRLPASLFDGKWTFFSKTIIIGALKDQNESRAFDCCRCIGIIASKHQEQFNKNASNYLKALQYRAQFCLQMLESESYLKDLLITIGQVIQNYTLKVPLKARRDLQNTWLALLPLDSTSTILLPMCEMLCDLVMKDPDQFFEEEHLQNDVVPRVITHLIAATELSDKELFEKIIRVLKYIYEGDHLRDEIKGNIAEEFPDAAKIIRLYLSEDL